MEKTIEKKVTGKYLSERFGNDNIQAAVDYCNSLKGEYPKKPQKPTLSITANSKEAKEYAAALEQYESVYLSYKTELEAYRKLSGEIDEELEWFIKDQSGLFNVVPIEKQDKVWGKAWSDGHSSGYGEVYGCLCNLVDLFS